MIIASDLDRTLIYSSRAIKELGGPEKSELKPIEEKDGNWVSFMTERSYHSLKELSKHCLFIPVTTRTTDQFKRFIFDEDIELPYVITSNGANIFYRGELIKEWSTNIFTRLEKESVLQEELLAIMKARGFYFDGHLKQAENQFFYYILNNLPTASEKRAINELTSKLGWRISLQGRKLYFIPNAISKGNALEFICNREGMEALAGSGDSILDLDFLQYCRYRYVPKHGELASVSENISFTITRSNGVNAGAEILQQFLNLLPLKV